jgi:uncharacterized protein YbaP (TraB family)
MLTHSIQLTSGSVLSKRCSSITKETPAAFEIVMPASALNHCLLQRNEDWYQHKLPKAQEHHVFVTQFLPANMPVVSEISQLQD